MRTVTLRTLIYVAAGIGLIVTLYAARQFNETTLRSL